VAVTPLRACSGQARLLSDGPEILCIGIKGYGNRRQCCSSPGTNRGCAALVHGAP
jgi:hypothetical protein